ncbi:MAG: glycosyltransferase family 4 protein [bacterium]
MNAIDTNMLREIKKQVSPCKLDEIKRELGIHSDNIAIYTGGLYAEKRISFLLDAARRIRQQLPDFHLIIIGSGPDASIVEAAACSWIHYLGPKNDEEKIPYWMISKVLLMPGAVGLVILDSFALGIPMVTTDVGNHGPEIDYLQDGVNGIMVKDTENAQLYAKAAVDLLSDEPRRLRLVAAGSRDADHYTIERMSEAFTTGIVNALNERVLLPVKSPLIQRHNRVLIIQDHMPHYRISFYESLKRCLAEHSLDLTLVFNPRVASNVIAGHLPWAKPVKISWLGKIGWQPVFKYARCADLIIVQQEMKYGVSFPLDVYCRLTGKLFAFWGHGRNFQARNPDSLVERWKRFFCSKVDWWFAYNDLSARVVKGYGFPSEKITNVQNSIDTRIIRSTRAMLDQESLDELKVSMGIVSDHIAVYTGGLYPDKRVSFLLTACDLIRLQIPDFQLIVIGKGEAVHLVQEAALQTDWIHYLGAKSDEEKVPFWAISKVFLMPGLVGLAILDSFALGVPMVTTAYPYHSPEIDYLKNGVNGIMVEDWKNPAAYARAVIDLFRDEPRRQKIIEAGKADAEIYTIENMAENFADGILKALDLRPH